MKYKTPLMISWRYSVYMGMLAGGMNWFGWAFGVWMHGLQAIGMIPGEITLAIIELFHDFKEDVETRFVWKFLLRVWWGFIMLLAIVYWLI